MKRRSGGPRTSEGKAVSRLNAAKSGLYSESPVLPEVEKEDEWIEHRRGVFDAIAPANYLEEALTERVAVILWRFKRLVRYEREQVRNRQSGLRSRLAETAQTYIDRGLEPDPEDLDLIRRRFMDYLIPAEKELDLLMRYEGRNHRHLLQLLHELEAMKAARRGESTPLAPRRYPGHPGNVVILLPHSRISPLPRTGDPAALGDMSASGGRGRG